MKIYIASPTPGVDKKMIDFVKWVCETVIANQSLKKAGKGEFLIPFDVEIKVTPSETK